MSEEGQGAAGHAKQAAAEGADPSHTDAAELHDASNTVSQNSVTQMTESSAPTPAGEGGKWRCEACTYENFPLSRKCTMCRFPKPVLGEDIFKLQDGASALPAPAPSPAPSPVSSPAPEPAGAEAIAERLKPLRISSPQGHSGSCSVSKWPCLTCTYENWPRALKCAMCGAPPASPAPRHGKPLAGTGEAPGGCGGGAGQGVEPELRRARRSPPAPSDYTWLQACLGVVEGDGRRVEAYLSQGGDPARALAPHELLLLNRASAFDAGHTLVHLAIRFQREEILATLLSRISGGGSGLKRSPSYIAPDLAAAIRRHIAGCVRFKKGSFPCRYINEFCTFSLPCDIAELPAATREQLFSELVDGEAQRALEAPPAAINWGAGARLHALWNRSAGDCLPDALCQAAYGVADRDNTLRAALAASLQPAGPLFARWAAWERAQAARLHYAPTDAQLRGEWARLLAAAPAPRTPLRPLHVFALAHVLRRPLVVYGVDVVHSFRGEPLGYAGFQGLYLPLLWEPGWCSKAPLCLGYTRGHFSALVPADGYSRRTYICRAREEDEGEGEPLVPLTDAGGKLLPVHFLTEDETEQAEALVRRWVGTVRRRGLLLARQGARARPLLQGQLLEEWLNHYRRLAQQTRGPFPPPPRLRAHYCTPHRTDDE